MSGSQHITGASVRIAADAPPAKDPTMIDERGAPDEQITASKAVAIKVSTLFRCGERARSISDSGAPADRQKNPHPSTQDPAHEKAVRADVAEILADRSYPAAALLNRERDRGDVYAPTENNQLTPRTPCPSARARSGLG
jgi:hypothetical protein